MKINKQTNKHPQVFFILTLISLVSLNFYCTISLWWLAADAVGCRSDESHGYGGWWQVRGAVCFDLCGSVGVGWVVAVAPAIQSHTHTHSHRVRVCFQADHKQLLVDETEMLNECQLLCCWEWKQCLYITFKPEFGSNITMSWCNLELLRGQL